MSGQGVADQLALVAVEQHLSEEVKAKIDAETVGTRCLLASVDVAHDCTHVGNALSAFALAASGSSVSRPQLVW